MRTGRTITSLILAIAAGSASAGGGDGVSITTVFKRGDAAPGLPGIEFLNRGGAASINDNGDILASAVLAGEGVTSSNQFALVSRSGGVLSMVARGDDPAASLPGYVYRTTNINTTGFSELGVTSGGELSFTAQLLETATSTFGVRGVFTGSVGGLAPVLHEQGVAPGFPGSTFFRYLGRYAHRDGRTVMLGNVRPENVGVLWFGTPGSMTAALQSQLQAPGLPIGINISSFSDDSLGTDGFGNVLFRATLPLGSGVTQSNRVLLYAGPPSNVGIVARTGDAVPGLAGAVYTGFESESLRMNTGGAYCFQAFVSGGGTDEAVMSCGGGSCFVLAKDGDPVPGLPGLTLNRVARSRIDMNGLGRVAFACVLVGAPSTSDSAIFIGGPAGIEMMVREGDPLPGGEVVSDLQGARWYINDREQVVASISGGLYATRPNGEWVELARAGEAFFSDDGFSGVTHPSNAFSFDFDARSTSGSGTSIFNNHGELVMSVLTNGAAGSGVFLFDIDDPCVADFAEPFDTLNFFDLGAFLTAFNAQDPAADLADPVGVFNFFDLGAFLSAFNEGCPD